MKKELPILTDEEKLQFLKKRENLENNEKKELKSPPNKVSIHVTLPMCIFMGAVSSLFFLIGAGHIGATIFASLFSATAVLTPIFTDISFRKYQNTIIKEISGDKLNAKQYFQLVKSGEIAKWEQQFANEIEAHKNMIKGIKVEQYKQKAENDIINSVYNSLPKEEGVILNSEEIAKKVSSLIEESNKNNSSNIEK